MLSAEDNELLCRVGPGTPMGELMRRFWLPAIMSSELEVDGEPMRLMLLGEKLIAFRDTYGRVGVMDHECPHRCATLFYGRNEEGGIRCIYHGWKFDVEGNCLDQPNVPAKHQFKDRLKAPAYKVRERNGVIWVYMGPGEPPGLPEFPICENPIEDLKIARWQHSCNWLQVSEGDQDTSHTGFLHGTKTKETDFDDERKLAYTNLAPEYEVMETDWGTMYGAIRPAANDQNYWRVGNYCFPFWASGRAVNGSQIVARVPMDDTHTMSIQIVKVSAFPKFPNIPDRANRTNHRLPDSEIYQPNTTDWYGRWRPLNTAENDHLIDRERQRNENFSGIRGAPQQDGAVQDSMGPIANRTKEHLALSDRMIIVTRRRILNALKTFRETGEVPLIASRPDIFGKLAGASVLAPKEMTLWEVYEKFALPNMLALQLGTPRAAE